MFIIPAIDIIDGKVVRLEKGNYALKKEYSDDPVTMAQLFEDGGLTRLHLVDLDGAKQRKVINWKVLEAITNKTSLQVDFGGGVQSNQDINIVFEAGAKQVTAGSVAIRKPELLAEWLETYGSEKIILGADVSDDKIAIGAWEEASSISWHHFIEEKITLGAKYVISTDIEKDGMLTGPSFDLYKKMSNAFPGLKVIASGGVSSVDDLIELERLQLFGAIVGKAYYEGKLSIEQMSQINNNVRDAD